jgi:hypothetical protein
MSAFKNWQELGILSLQDTEAGVPPELRQCIAAGRVASLGDRAKSVDPDDLLVQYGTEWGMGTIGDVHPFAFWQTVSRKVRGMGSWSPAFAALVTSDGEKRYGNYGAINPIWDRRFIYDGRYGAKHAGWPGKCFQTLPEGTIVTAMAGTAEQSQQDIMVYTDPRLFAVNVRGPGEHGTLVCDLQPEGVICMDDADDPGMGGRHARLQTMMRVVCLGDVGSLGGFKGNAVAWQLGATGQEGLAGYGLCFAKLEQGGSTSAGPVTPGGGDERTGPITPRPQQPHSTGGDGPLESTGGDGGDDGPLGWRGPLSGEGPAGKPRHDPWIHWRPNKGGIKEPGGGSGGGGSGGGGGGGSKKGGAPKNSPCGFGEFEPKRTKAYGSAFMAHAPQYGPFTAGHENDKHQFGKDRDGNPVNSGHISSRAFIFDTVDRDGPFLFEGAYPNPPQYPLISRVHLTWDAGMVHEWALGARFGKWRWYAEVPYLTPYDDIPPDEPPDEPPGPPTGGPGRPGTPDIPTPGGPTTGGGGRGGGGGGGPTTGGGRTPSGGRGPTTGGGGRFQPGGPSGPFEPLTPGGTPKEPEGGPTTGEDTRGPRSDGPTGPSSGPDSPNPPPPDPPFPPVRTWSRDWRSRFWDPWPAPYPPDPPPNPPEPADPLDAAGVGWEEPWWDDRKKYGAAGGPGASDPSRVDDGSQGRSAQTLGRIGQLDHTHRSLYTIFHPMQEGFAELTWRPQLTVRGYPAFTHNPDMTPAMARNDEAVRPQVLTMRAWGAQAASGDWDYTERPLFSRARGGTADGGILLAPPEWEMEDYLQTREAIDVRETSTTSYLMAAPGVGFALGLPVDDGWLQARAVTIRQEANGGIGGSNDPLVVSQLDSNRNEVELLYAELDQATSEVTVLIGGSQALRIPRGTTAERPAAVGPVGGEIRINTNVSGGVDTVEYYDAQAATWKQLGAGSGSGNVPIGGIILWSGSIASIPSGYAICDGTGGTPDLRDRFVVGAGSAYSVGATGGATSVTPAGTLSADASGVEVDDHDFSFEVDSGSGGYASDGQAVSHAVSDPTHSHTFTGSSQENRPPYYALAYIMRTS